MVNTRSSSILEGIYRASSDPSRRVGLSCSPRRARLSLGVVTYTSEPTASGLYTAVLEGMDISPSERRPQPLASSSKWFRGGWLVRRATPHHQLYSLCAIIQAEDSDDAFLVTGGPKHRVIRDPSLYGTVLSLGTGLLRNVQKLSDTAVGGAGPCFRISINGNSHCRS